MAHIGIICPAATGHLNPCTTLGFELKQRGHRVSVLGIADARPKVEAAGLEFQSFGAADFPVGATQKLFAELGNLSGFKALQYTISWIARGAEVCLQEVPDLVKMEKMELLLVDQGSPEGGTIAEHLDIPFISIACALMFNRENRVPPFNTIWKCDTSWRGLLKNQLGYTLLDLATKPITKTINNFRQQWNLPLHTHPNQRYSPLAQISQQPAEFEFPRPELPENFYFTGSFSNPQSRVATDFPFELLTGQPVIYASLGTLQNRLLWIFEAIAKACQDLDAQLVVALGGGAKPKDLELPGNTITVGYAPQLELLQRASLTITHAGLNTTLESLSHGVPLVAIPITNDQPGVAARITWTGVGEFIPLKQVSVNALRPIIRQVLNQESYRQNAARIQQAMAASGGVGGAADIIEKVIASAT